eukprot:193255-Pyramimonas_sp.AAC.2
MPSPVLPGTGGTLIQVIVESFTGNLDLEYSASQYVPGRCTELLNMNPKLPLTGCTLLACFFGCLAQKPTMRDYKPLPRPLPGVKSFDG